MTRAMQKRLAKNRASGLAGVRACAEVGIGKPKPVHRPIQAHRNLSPKGGFVVYRVS